MPRLALQLQVVNDSARLSSFFAMLKSQTYKDWHLYVLDNGSNAVERVKIREIIERSGVAYTFFRVHPGIGETAGHNFLFSRHDSEYLLTLSLDQNLSDDFFEKHTSYLDEHLGCGSFDGMYRRSAALLVSDESYLFDASFVMQDAVVDLLHRLHVAGFTHAHIGDAPKIRRVSRNKNLLSRLKLRRQTTPSPVVSAQVPEYDIAVITVAHNDVSDVGLKSLERARKATSLKVGVVFVDNGSVKYRLNEFVGERIPDAHVVLREKNYGFGDSCNRGAREVRARYYFFLNPDTILEDEKIFDKLWTFMQTHSDAGIVAPKIFYFDGRLQETCRRFPAWFVPFVQRTGLKNTKFGKRYTEHFQMSDYDHEVLRAVDWVQGSAMCVDSEVLHTLGGFDQRYFMYFEDIDLCRRVGLMGKKVYYDPDITLKHAHGKESARVQGFIQNLLTNKIARAHIASWLKYMLKWLGR